ncbi:MAG: helix-turn-helix domain-containing protein [Schleiferiaceae bacterium]|nr:helix-turn-helix domain-containing protein [Schleiferiaceae bacterium]
MLHANLKVLRKRKRLSQEDLAQELELTRSTLSAYENQMAEPNVSTLLRIANYFKISLDRLLRQDLSKLAESDLREIELGLDHDVMGKRLRILTTTVNSKNEENVQVVTAKARAGYTSGYADPEYLSELPRLHLPMLHTGKTYRAFPIIGDSMPPVSEGSFVVGSYVEDWKLLREGKPYIVVTQSDGIVFKVVFNWLDQRGSLQLCSTNPDYPPYEVSVQEVLEIWSFENYICPTLPTPDLDKEVLSRHLLKLQQEVDALKKRMH